MAGRFFELNVNAPSVRYGHVVMEFNSCEMGFGDDGVSEWRRLQRWLNTPATTTAVSEQSV